MSERLDPERPASERLREWLSSHGIKVALFDLDDTLIKTREIFQQQASLFIEFVSSLLPDHNPVELRAALERINDNAYKDFAVNPQRWEVVVKRMTEEYGPRSRDALQKGLPILMEIYKILPEFHEGAPEVLEEFRASGAVMGMVTHANVEWTIFKLEGLNLRPYFQHILIVDQNKHKGSEDWQKALELSRIKAENAMVVGDNLPGDIQAAAKNRCQTPPLDSQWLENVQHRGNSRGNNKD